MCFASCVPPTVAELSPIVLISAQLRYNIDTVNEYIVKRIPIPLRDFTSDPRLIVTRSFDVNKPGAEVDGGVADRLILTGCGSLWKSRLAREWRRRTIQARIGAVRRAGRTHQRRGEDRLDAVSRVARTGSLGSCSARSASSCNFSPVRVYFPLRVALLTISWNWKSACSFLSTLVKRQAKVTSLELLLINISSTSAQRPSNLTKVQLMSLACVHGIVDKVALSHRMEGPWPTSSITPLI